MLRITTIRVEGCTTIGVEGSLTDPFAKELRNCWQEVLRSIRDPEDLCVDLVAMTNIDSIGKEILIELYRSGVRLLGSGVMTRAVIDDITRRQ